MRKLAYLSVFAMCVGVLAVIFAVARPGQVYAAVVVPPKPISEHPRVFARAIDRSALHDKFYTSSGWAKVAADTLKSYRDKFDEDKTFYPSLVQYNSTNQWRSNANEDYRRAIESYAFMHLIEPGSKKDGINDETNYGKLAVEGAKQYFEYVAFPKIGYDEHVIGAHIMTLALVYDWCYDRLTADDKKDFIEYLERMASQLSVGYPTFKYSVITSHGANEVWKLDLLAAGIAMYDEKQEMYNIASNVMFNQFAPSRDYLYESEMPYMGIAYGPATYITDLMPAWLYKRMGLASPYENSEAMSQVLSRDFYERRPDGQLLRGGDNYIPTYSNPGDWWITSSYISHPAYLYQDAKLLYQEDRDYPYFGTDNPIYALLFRDLSLTPASESTIESMPYTKYFGSPIGSMIARTGWDSLTGDQIDYDKTDVIAEMKIQENTLNGHTHYDAGSFQLYYKGALAIKSGMYNGITNDQPVGFGSDHDLNYHKRSVASNTLLIEDDNETFTWGPSTQLSKDGGQRIVNSGYEAKNLEQLQDASKGYKTGTVLAFGWGGGPDGANKPNFSYLKGDIAPAYSSKVSSVKRSFVFLNLKDSGVPAALITYDYIAAASSNYEKKWLLHSIEDPTISGNQTTIVRDDGDYNGKLVNTTLLPASVDIVKIGGANQQFMVDNVNYPIEPRNLPSPDEAGSYRVEISPHNEQATDQLLNIMQVMDANTSPVPVTGLIAQVHYQSGNYDRHYGVQIKDRAVFFSKEGVENGDTLYFHVNGQTGQDIQFLITDMAPGYWDVHRNGATAFQVISTTEGKYISFTGWPGDYTITYWGNSTVFDTVLPSIPADLKASSKTENSVTLTWTASTDNVGVDQYEVFRNGVSIGTTSTNSKVVTGLISGTTYDFTVKAKDKAGNQSAASSTLRIAPADTEPPSVPGNVRVKVAGGKLLLIGWDYAADNVGVTGYDIYEGSNLLKNVDSTSNLAFVTPIESFTMTPSTLYHLTVVAKDAAGNTSAARTKLIGDSWNMQSSSLDAWTTSGKFNIAKSSETYMPETYIEASKYQVVNGYWELVPDANRASGVYVRTKTGLENHENYLEYEINVPTGDAGIYYVKLLAKGNGESNSWENYMSVRMDHTTPSPQRQFYTNGVNNNWGWVTSQLDGNGDPLGFNLTAGTHTLSLMRGASGISIDQIAISKSKDLPPTGAGTAAKPLDTINPTKPNLSYEKGAGTNQFLLSWTPSVDNNESPVQYEVWRKRKEGVNETTEKVRNASVTTSFDTGTLSTSIEYTYWVKAIDAGDGAYSANSNNVSIKPY